MKTVYPKDPIPTFNEWMQYINKLNRERVCTK